MYHPLGWEVNWVQMARAVLVTGAGSGIGLATARLLTAKGYRVYGGVRREEDAARLAQEGVVPLLLDVTREEDLLRARERLVGEGLWGLVVNAGIAVAGPLELVPLSAFREALEVNVLGAFATVKAFLPLLRAPRGRVVLMGSAAGRVATWSPRPPGPRGCMAVTWRWRGAWRNGAPRGAFPRRGWRRPCSRPWKAQTPGPATWWPTRPGPGKPSSSGSFLPPYGTGSWPGSSAKYPAEALASAGAPKGLARVSHVAKPRRALRGFVPRPLDTGAWAAYP